MLRIGRIEYANCTPIFRALQEYEPGLDYKLVGGVPARLNAMLCAGLIDVCPSSSIEYARHSEHYLILPHLSISSVGAVGSVLLFSRVPLKELDRRNILLSSESATSVNLLKILLEKRFGCRCNYKVHTSSFYEALREAPALLLIGDAALRASILDPDLLVYDLGQLWHEWTGLPFVFALWLCRRQVAIDRYAEVADLTERLAWSKYHAGENLQSIAEDSPEASWMGADRLEAYWRDNISYDLDDRHLEGLILFYRYCAELDLLTAVPELHFLAGSSQKDS
ncbi:MAG: menaquinone biosynthesis protein [Desulfobacteraceae bacterium]|nr:menaquinone biosynthesis protein [Desulfobacteraceae bacterium]